MLEGPVAPSTHKETGDGWGDHDTIEEAIAADMGVEKIGEPVICGWLHHTCFYTTQTEGDIVARINPFR